MPACQVAPISRSSRSSVGSGRARLVIVGKTNAPTARSRRFWRVAIFVGLWAAATLTYAVGITYFPLFEYSDNEAPTLANSLFWGAILGALVMSVAVITQRRNDRSSV